MFSYYVCLNHINFISSTVIYIYNLWKFNKIYVYGKSENITHEFLGSLFKDFTESS